MCVVHMGWGSRDWVWLDRAGLLSRCLATALHTASLPSFLQPGPNSTGIVTLTSVYLDTQKPLVKGEGDLENSGEQSWLQKEKGGAREGGLTHQVRRLEKGGKLDHLHASLSLKKQSTQRRRVKQHRRGCHGEEAAALPTPSPYPKILLL